MPLTQSLGKKREMLGMLTDNLAIARTVGSQENSIKEWDEDILLRSRR